MRKPSKTPQSILTRNLSVSIGKGQGNHSGILSEKTSPDTQERLNSEFFVNVQTNVSRYTFVPLNTLNEIAHWSRTFRMQGPPFLSHIPFFRGKPTGTKRVDNQLRR